MRKSIKFPHALVLLVALSTLVFPLPSTAAAPVGQTIRTTYTQQFSTEPNPCTGEVLVGTATVKEIIHITENSTGYHQVNQIVFDGTAIGEVSGTQYEFHEVYMNEFNYQNRSVCQIEQTTPITFRFITSGATDNWTVKALFHTTVTPDCKSTATIDNARVECQG